MKRAIWDVISAMEEHKVSMREAAYIVGVGRVALSLRALGRAA